MSGRSTAPGGEEAWQAVLLQTQGSSTTVIINWGTTIVAGFQDGAIKVFTSEGHLQGTLVGHQRPITALGVDNMRLISAAQDGALRVWATDGQCMRVVPFGDAPIAAMLMMAPRLYTAHDRDVRVSSAGSYAQLGWLRGHESDVTCLTSWNGKLVSGSIDTTVRVWKLPAGECERTLRGHTDVVTCVVGWGSAIASSSWDRTVRIWAVDDDKKEKERVLSGHKGKVLCLALHAPLDVLFSGAADRTIRAWTIGGECVKVFEGWFSAAISALSVFEGQLLLAGAQDGALGAWRLPPPQVVHNAAVTFVRPRGASPFSSPQDPLPPSSPRGPPGAAPLSEARTAAPAPSPGRDTLKSSFGDRLRSLAANVTGKSERGTATKSAKSASAAPAQPVQQFSVYAEFVRRGDVAGLRDALSENGAQLTTVTDDQGQTLLHLAAAEGRLPIVRMLISRNIVNATDRRGWTPLLYAATGSHLAVCKLLLENHASASACTSTGSNTLHLLCRCAVSSPADKQELVELMGLLASRGADVSQRNIHGLSPLHEAAACGRAEVAYLLLDAGADPMVVSKLGETPIQIAMRKNYKDVVVVIRSRLTAEQRAALPDDAQRSPGSTLIAPSPLGGSFTAAPISGSGSAHAASPLALATASSSSASVPSPLANAAASASASAPPAVSPPPSPKPTLSSLALPSLRLPKTQSGDWKQGVRHDKSPGSSPTASPRTATLSETSISPRGSLPDSISPRRAAAPPDFAYALMPPIDAPPDTRSAVFTTAIAASASIHLMSPRGPGAMRVSYSGVAYRLPDGAPQPARLVIFTRRAALLISTSGGMLPEVTVPRMAAEHRRDRMSVMPASPEYTQLSFTVERLQVRSDIAPGAVEIFDPRAPDQGKFVFKPADSQRDLSTVLAERSAAHRAELLFSRGLVALHDGFLVFLRNLQTKAAEFTTPPTLIATMQGIVREIEVLAARLAEVDAEAGLRMLDERLSQHQRLVALFCEFYTTFPPWLRAYLPDELGDIPLRYCAELREHVSQPDAARYPAAASLLSQLAVLDEQLRKLSAHTEPIRTSRRATIIRPQFAYVMAQRAIVIPDQDITIQRGERGIIISDGDPLMWRVRFTPLGAKSVEAAVPIDALFRVTKDITKDSY